MNTQAIRDWLDGLPAELSMGLLYDLLLLVVVAVLVAVGVRVSRDWISRGIEDVNRRHRLRKRVGYAGALLVVLVALTLFVGRLGALAAFVAVVAAGVAIALQDVAKSTVGWVYISGRTGIGPGARVEMDGVVGEVIDVGVLKTTVLEVGHLVYGRQSSGRLISIPNSRFLTENVVLSPDFSPYAWQEIQFVLTYESDWRGAAEVLEEIGLREHEGDERAVRYAFRAMEERYAFKHGPLTPIVYVKAAESGVEITLRFLTHIRKRRGAGDRVTRAMLEAVERDPKLDFAYPTWRIYTRGEGEET